MRRSGFASPPRRRRSPVATLAIVLVVLLLGFLVVYLWTLDTEVPTQRIEQDVTNELLAG